MERRYRSLIWALWRQQWRHGAAAPAASGARWSLFVTFANGMQELVDALAARLPDGSIRLHSPVAGLARGQAGRRWRIGLEDGSALDADAVLMTAEAHRTARVVGDLDEDLARQLEAIPYAGSATVTLAYRRGDIPHPLDGFGFVVPRTEGRPILACTFSSVKYPGRAPEGHVLLRLFFGGALQGVALKLDNDGLIAAARGELGDLLGVSAPPLLSRVYRHEAVMPQYLVGHLDRVAAIESRLARHPGLAVAGSAFRGVGIADCIHTGEDAAEKLIRELRE
jgi:oxygen-dependent protoporphyrinogen oxidase